MTRRDRRRLCPVLLTLSLALVSPSALGQPAGGLGDARKAFETARGMGSGSNSAGAWRNAAAMYRRILDAAPGADDAPEAAINAAYAYKQAGELGAALDTYELFVREGGRLLPRLAADPRRHAELAKLLAMASQERAHAYVLLFDYPRAAASFDILATDATLGETERRDAAQNALLLWAALGDAAKASEARMKLYRLSPTATQRADADSLVVELALRAWDKQAPDEGANRRARRAAESEMERWLSAHKGDATALAHTVRIAHHLAELRRAGHEPRADEPCKQGILAFDRLRAVEERRTFGSREADLAAECAYGLLDREIDADFDRVMAHRRYDGKIPEVKKALTVELERANGYARKLEELAARFPSPTWAVAAKAREGSLYEAYWKALHELLPPEYRDLRAPLLEQAAQVAVRSDGQAVALARSLRIHVPAADAALRRLASWTDVLGDPQMRTYTAAMGGSRPDQLFVYRDRMFLRERPGMALTGPLELLPPPAPSAE